MSDVGRKVVPDKGRLNRERPVTKALDWKEIFFSSELERTVRDGVYTESRDDIWWQGTIKERESKGGYLEKYPFFDWESVKRLRSGTCSCLLLRKMTLAA